MLKVNGWNFAQLDSYYKYNMPQIMNQSIIVESW